MKKPTLLPLTALFLIAGLCLLGCEESSPAKKEGYTVSFDLNGATGSIASQTIAANAKVAQPDAPTRDGYTFEGWYTDEATTQDYDFDSPVTADITLYAKWVEAFTVSFDSNGGSAVESLTLSEGDKVAQPTDPSKDDYFFGGWYTDEATTQEYDFATATITTDIILYAKWIEATNRVLIPDFSFRTHLKERIGDAFEGEYMDTTHANVLGLTSLDVPSKDIFSLVGIKYFTGLTSLACSSNSFFELDVSHNTALNSLVCSNNRLSELDVSKNTALSSLFCNNNSLTELDVSKNTALVFLSCLDNSLTELNLTRNTDLTLLNCKNNELTALDVRQSTALTELDCSLNSLTALDLSSNTALSYLACSDNNLTSLNLSSNTALGSLVCSDNNLTGLNLPSSTALTFLNCSNNSLTALDVRQNTALTQLDCPTNSLNELNVSQNTALTRLDCSTNSLTALNVSQNTALTRLDCSTNSLTALNVSQNTALTRLDCSTNSLTALNVSQNTALTQLGCTNNSLTALDLSSNTALLTLSCQNNQLARLDLRGIKRFSRLVINAGTATNPITQLYVHEDVKTHDEIKEAKTNREAAITISTYNDTNTQVCANFDPNGGAEGACKD